MIELKELKADIIESGLKNHQKLFYTREYRVKSSGHRLINSENYSSINIQRPNLKPTLPVDLISQDTAIKPFWNELSTAIHSTLWQPHRIELPEQDSNSSNGWLNYQEAESSFWKKKIQPSNLTQKHSLPSLPALSIRITENEVRKDEKPLQETISQKIRIYPKNERLWFDSLNLFRRAYNLSIEFFKKGTKPCCEFRTDIQEWCKLECVENCISYNSNLVQAAYRKASETRSSVIKNRTNKQKSKMRFLKRNDTHQYFLIPRLSPNKQIYPNILGECDWSEIPADEAIGKTAIINYSNGVWHASTKQLIDLPIPKENKLKIIALDPGVRTFQTGFSEEAVIIYGDKFVEDKLVSLMLKLDSLLSLKTFLMKQDKCLKWVMHTFKNTTRRINKLRTRQRNLVEDLHRRVAFDLVSNYDLILLPSFETRKMVRRSNETKQRFIQRKTVRGMLGLAHYKFKQTLKWMAKKYGKAVIEANESYTSKTMTDGSILQNLGAKSSIQFQNKRVNRDHHGARNILIRFITKAIEGLSPKEAYSLNITKWLTDIKNYNPTDYSEFDEVSGFGVLK